MSHPPGLRWVIILPLLLSSVPPVMGGTLLVNQASTPADVLISHPAAASYTRSFHNDSNNGKTARGNSFLMPDTGDSSVGYKVTGVTLRKDANQSFSSGDLLTLWFFTWDPKSDGNDGSSWTRTGTNGMADGDPLSGTGMTALLVESYDLDGLSFTDEQFFTFDISANPIYVAENKAYGFLVRYTDGGGSGSAYFQFRESSSSSYPDGVELRTQGTISANTIYSPRDVTFFIHGEVIDTATYQLDSDEDGLSDVWETLNFFGLVRTGEDDPDEDGADNEAEETAGTDPNAFDSDHDGLNDGLEITGPTDPLDPDSDDDNLLDGVESGSGIYISSLDTGTNPMVADTDNDGINDGLEINRGFDPSDITHIPGELPNIVFIMIDDLDIREIGVYGQASLQTPRVDTMASQGMLFTDMYTASPVCHSCRSSLITGQDSRRSQDRFNAGSNGYQTPLDPSRVTIAEVLNQAGYTTGCVGKWGMGGPTTSGAPWNQGFDFFCGYLGQVQAHRSYPKYLWKNDQKIYFDQALATTEGGTLYIPGASNPNATTHDWTDAHGNVASHDVVVAEGLQFIEDNANRPFFLYCAWTPPHAFNYPAATLAALTDADGLVYDPLDHSQTLIGELYPGAPFGGTPATPDFQPHTYASMVSAADRDTGRIMDKLVELGIDDKTLVIFCSDNGEAGDTFLSAAHLKPGYFDLRGAKKDTYEGGIRAPFVAWWPGTIPAGATSGVIGTFADMLPTFADLAGLSTPPQVTGRSILPALLGGAEGDLQPRDYHYWSFRENSNSLFRRWRAVRQGDWKLVRDRVNNGSAPTYELFNLASDLYETTDLSATEPSILARLIPLVEGTHEVSRATYFRADDEFFTQTNLTAAAYLIGTPDGSGAENGYSLTPDGTGSCFNYLPFEEGLNKPATFTWTMQFTSGGAASFLLGATNDPALCLAVRIDPSTLGLEVSNVGSVVAGGTLLAGDIPLGRTECSMRVDPTSGAGVVRIGSTVLPFDLSTSIGPLRFWGFEVEAATVQTSRPHWQLGSMAAGGFEFKDGTGIINGSYRIPFGLGQAVINQYSFDLETWHDHPPGLIDSRATNSQGQLEGSWLLPKDSLLTRQGDRLFLRASREP